MITQGANATPLISTLSQIYDVQSLPGLYQGLVMQLSHTVLKAALLMAIREKISEITSRESILFALRSRKPSRSGSFHEKQS